MIGAIKELQSKLFSVNHISTQQDVGSTDDVIENQSYPNNPNRYQSKMAFLKMTKLILNKCGLYDYDDSIVFFIYLKFLVIVTFLFATFATCFHFVVLNLDLNNIQNASNAIFAANIMCIGSIYCTMIFYRRDKLQSIIHEIETIIETRKSFIKCPSQNWCRGSLV